MTVVYDQVWTCACGTENVRRFTCTACSRMRPPGPAGTFAPMPPAPAVVAGTQRTTKAVLKHLARASIAVVAIVAALAGLGVYQAYRQHDAEKRLKAYIEGSARGTEFVAADLQFRATFPKAPQHKVDTVDVGGIHVRYSSYIAQLGENDGFAVSGYDVTPSTPFDLNGGVNGSAVGMHGRVESATPTRFLGVNAIEAVVSIKGGFVKEVIFRKGEHVWLLAVSGKDEPPVGYDAFVGSFSLL